MSDTHEWSKKALDREFPRTQNDSLQCLKDEDISTIINTGQLSTKSRIILFQILHLLEEKDKEIDSKETVDDDSADERIQKFSEEYKLKYTELLRYFKTWKPLRLELLKLLKSSSDNLEKCSTAVSVFRIFTSAADILGTIMRYTGSSENSLANLIMENASWGGVLALFLETVISKKIHADMKEAIKKDQEWLKKIEEWFTENEELDTTIRSFFPHGIDKDVIKMIHSRYSNFKDYEKLFIAVVTSYVKQNEELYKNKDFLDTARRFSMSEVGKIWFQKVVIEKDHIFAHDVNSVLGNEIQALLKKSPTDNPELYLNGCSVLSSIVKKKVLLKSIEIISAVTNLYAKEKPEILDALEKLLNDLDRKLEIVQSMVLLQIPSESQKDPIFED